TDPPVTPPASARRVGEQYLALLEPLGVRPAAIEFPLPRDLAAEARVDAFLARWGVEPRDRLVVLLPGAGRAAKRWSADRFAALAARLTAETSGPVLVGWGPGERETAKAIVDSARGGLIELAPASTIAELIATARRPTEGPRLAAPGGMKGDMRNTAGSRLCQATRRGHRPRSPRWNERRHEEHSRVAPVSGHPPRPTGLTAPAKMTRGSVSAVVV